MSFSCQKGEFDRFFNRLDRPVEESRPDRCRSTLPVSISASDFGEDLFFSFLFFGDHLLLVRKFVISARKSLRISAKTWRSPAYGRKICDFGQKKPSHFGENLCPPDLAKLATPLHISTTHVGSFTLSLFIAERKAGKL